MLKSFVNKAMKAFKMMKEQEQEMNDKMLEKIEKNLYWQQRLDWDLPTIVKVLGSLNVSTVESSIFVNEVKRFQKNAKLVPDGIVGPNTWDAFQDYVLDPYDRAVRKIMEPTIGKESAGRYWAMNKDGEFRGRFKNHRAEGKIHVGLSFGILQFTQDGGMLGKYLKRCAKANPERFKATMGKTWDTLIHLTNISGDSGMKTGKLRGPRVKRVAVVVDANGTLDERDLWEEPWVTKFNKLGRIPEFQKIQRDMAQEHYLRPMLKFLKANGLTSEKMVAAAFSGAIHRGAGGMRKFMQECIDREDNEVVILSCMISRDPGRFRSFKADKNLGWTDWEGWEHLNTKDLS